MIIRKVLLLIFLLLVSYGYSHAAELLAEQANIYYNDGVKEQKKGNLDAAKIAYQKTLVLAPKNINFQKYIMNNVGIMFAQQNEFDYAEASFQEALSIDPGYIPAKMNLGLVYEKKGDRLKALEVWAALFGIDKLKPKGFIVEAMQQQRAK